MDRSSTAPRRTRQRADIARALGAQDRFRTAQEIHAELRAAGKGVGLATVYRTLQALAGSGEIDVVRNDDGESLYRRCLATHHHHHIVCRQCGRSVEVASEEIEAWATQQARAHGFSDLSHTLEVYGVCRTCSD